MVRRRLEQLAAALGNLSLTAKGVLVVSIPVAALLVAMGIFYLLEQQTRMAESWVEHTFQVRSEIGRVMLLLSHAETASRGYLITKDKNSEDRYLEAVHELPKPLSSLRELTRDNVAQSSHLEGLQSGIRESVDTLEAIRRSAATGRMDEGLRLLDSSRRQMAGLRAELNRMQTEEDRLLSERTSEERGAQRKLEATVFAGGLLGLLGGLLGALFFAASISRRVHALESDAQQMAAGIPITTDSPGRDEIARLSRTLKETSCLLAAQNEQLRAAHSAANQELYEVNQIRQALIQSSPLAIWALDSAGRITFWNPAAERIFGYSEAEVLHQRPPVIPADQQGEYAEWEEIFRSGGSVLSAERVRRRKDGKGIDVIIWTAPVRDAKGNVTGTLVIDSDITDRKTLEEQFRQSQKLEAVGRLAGGVAHDFNNLLTVILGYVEMLVAEPQVTPDTVEYAREIQQAATRAGALTAQLLAFSRRQVSQPKVLVLNDVITQSERMLSRVIGEDVQISMHLDAQLGKVKVDPTHIDQLLMNLVVNARDAMGKGGKITIETANVQLDEHYVDRHIGVQPGAYAMLAVSDTGAGMTPDVKKRIFEPFFTTKELGKGTGLGLSIVYGIVKQSGGEIMVYSEVGQGTTFKIYLPLTEVPSELVSAEGKSISLYGNETVLLCEDEMAIRKLVQTMLVKYGYEVLEADTPQRALEISRQHRQSIHLLLTDVVMPLTSGFELARDIVAERPEIKVLYMSGYTDNRLTASWVFDPSTPFLHKPFTATVLAAKVREALAGNAKAGS